MGIRERIFNLVLRISRKKHKAGDSIQDIRDGYGLLAKTIYYLSRRPRNVNVDFSPWHGINSVRLIPKTKTSRVIIYFYGGAFIQQMDTMKYPSIPFAANLAASAQAQVWIPEYRAAPEHPFPAALEDCIASYVLLIKSGVDPKDITVMGTASGAALALSLVAALKLVGVPLPGSIATISAWTDLTMSAESIVTRSARDPVFNALTVSGYFKHYLQGKKADYHLISPLYTDFTGFPPMYMIVGGREIFYDDTARIAKKARDAGVEVTLDADENMMFSYPIFYEFVKEGKEAINRLGSFVKRTNDSIKAAN